jgi:hypothetical protein
VARRLPSGTGIPGDDQFAALSSGPAENGIAERFIRTLKENLVWVRSFATIAELAEVLGEFKRRTTSNG